MEKNKFQGSSFDDFLVENDMLAEANSAAMKRVIAWQLQKEMEKCKITKEQMAKKMGTSRAALDRLLDQSNLAVTLHTMSRAAAALNKQIQIKFVNA